MASRWRASPSLLARLLLGLTVFGAGEALVVAAALGNSPWTVLADGVSVQTPLGIGAATVLISFLLLVAWIPLRQAPGLGTVANAIVVGTALDLVLRALPADEPLGVRVVMLVAGILVVGVGSGIYLTCRLGPGPRDGLMTGLARRTGGSLRVVRAGIELGAFALGALLGGTFGIGTLAFALGVGPAVQLMVGRLDRRPDEAL